MATTKLFEVEVHYTSIEYYTVRANNETEAEEIVESGELRPDVTDSTDWDIVTTKELKND